MRRVDVSGEIIEVGETREVTLKNGGSAKVADCVLQDASGSGTVKLSLWDAQLALAVKGQKVLITNGYTNSFRGELRLNVGRYGNIEKA